MVEKEWRFYSSEDDRDWVILSDSDRLKQKRISTLSIRKNPLCGCIEDRGTLSQCLCCPLLMK